MLEVRTTHGPVGSLVRRGITQAVSEGEPGRFGDLPTCPEAGRLPTGARRPPTYLAAPLPWLRR